MPVNLGHIYATLGLDASQLNKNATEAEGRLTRLGGTLGNVAAKAAALATAALVAAPAIITAFVKSGMTAITTQQDLANSLGTTANALRAVQIAAGEAGVDSDSLNKALGMMNARLGEAQRGTGPTAEAIKRLGLNAKTLSDLPLDERMAAIADRVSALGMSSSQTAALLREFGIRGSEMVEFFRQGGGAIRDAAGDVRAFGLELTAVDAKMVDNAEESIQRMGLTLEGVRNKVTIALAPVLGVLADKFNDASKASGGFGDMAVNAIMKVARVLAFVGNAVRGVEIAFTGLKVVVVGIGLAFAEVGEAAVEAFGKLANYAIDRINEVIRALSAIGPDIEEIARVDTSGVMSGLVESSEASRNVIKTLMSDIRELASEKLPTQMLDEFIADVEKKQRELATAQVEARGDLGGGDFEEEDEAAKKAAKAAADKAAAEAKAKREALAAQLADMQKHVMSEQELREQAHQDRLALVSQGVTEGILLEQEGAVLRSQLTQKEMEERRAIAEEEFMKRREMAVSDMDAEIEEHEKRMEFMRDALEDRIVTEEEYRARVEELEATHQDRMYGIREAGLQRMTQVTISAFHQQSKFAAGYLADMTASVARENKVMFEINKAAGIANALLHAKEAIVGAYKVGAGIGGPVMGAAFAAVAAAATAAQVAAIASQSYGSKGAAPSLAGGTPAPPVTPVAGGTAPGQGGGGRLFVEGIDPGSIFSGRQMRELAERLLEYQRDGGQVVFAG